MMMTTSRCVDKRDAGKCSEEPETRPTVTNCNIMCKDVHLTSLIVVHLEVFEDLV